MLAPSFFLQLSGVAEFFKLHLFLRQIVGEIVRQPAGSRRFMIANTANKIGIPAEDFGLTPSGYNWKCDNVSVSYNGRAWFATLTWTRSGNNRGWNMKPYQE